MFVARSRTFDVRFGFKRIVQKCTHADSIKNFMTSFFSVEHYGKASLVKAHRLAQSNV